MHDRVRTNFAYFVKHGDNKQKAVAICLLLLMCSLKCNVSRVPRPNKEIVNNDFI